MPVEPRLLPHPCGLTAIRLPALARARRRGFARQCAMLLLAACCGSCAPGEPVTSGPLTRDSAGIAIIESATPLWTGTEGWTVADSPAFVIGVAQGAPAYELDRVRSATRLADGTVVVANSGSRELRFFDVTGRFVHSTGRDGEGPGEFRSIDGVWRYRADSLLAVDGALGRITILTRTGDPVRDFRIETGNPIVHVRGVFDDGSLLIESWPPAPDHPDGTAFEIFAEYLRFSADGTLLDSLGRFPKSLAVQRSQRGLVMVGPALFSPWTGTATSGMRMFVGTAKQAGIDIRDVRRAAPAILRWSGPVETVTATDRSRFLQSRLENAATEAARNTLRNEARDWCSRRSSRPMATFTQTRPVASGCSGS